MKRGSLPWRMGGESRREEKLRRAGVGLRGRFHFCGKKRPQSRLALFEASASRAPLGSTELGGVHTGPHPSPFGAQSFSFPLFDPILSLEDLRPGPVHPRLLSRPPWLPPGPLGSDAEAAAPSSQVCTHGAAPAPHTDASSGLPSRTSPWKPPQPSTASGLRRPQPSCPGALCFPPLLGSLSVWPFPCSATSWRLTPAGEGSPHRNSHETTHFGVVTVYFCGLKSIHCQEGRVGMLTVTAEVRFLNVCQRLQKPQFRNQRKMPRRSVICVS